MQAAVSRDREIAEIYAGVRRDRCLSCDVRMWKGEQSYGANSDGRLSGGPGSSAALGPVARAAGRPD